MSEPQNEVQAPFLDRLHLILDELDRTPYSIQLYIEEASAFNQLGYPDLAVGAAYKALLLCDSVNDECDEYYHKALSNLASCCLNLPSGLRTAWPAYPDADISTLRKLSLEDHESSNGDDNEEHSGIEPEEAESAIAWVNDELLPLIHLLLTKNLQHCQSYRGAYKHCQMGLRITPDHKELLELRNSIFADVTVRLKEAGESFDDPRDVLDEWSDTGLVRRECYPWNDIEPDRFSQESLDFLNAEMAKCAPLLEVKAVDLLALNSKDPNDSKVVKQLGVFAREDIEPGQCVLRETSLLTANNRLQDALCDACNRDIDSKTLSNGAAAMCQDCSSIFCSQECLDMANELYHPAVCDRDVDSIARDVPPAQAADSLYLLLLLRCFALAETQDIHPLGLKEVKYIWGDYHTTPITSECHPASTTDPFSSFPRSLQFSFDANVVLPLHMLTKMDVDIFASHRRYDIWIFNTLYAKFRGTASARLSGSGKGAGSRARGPEVSAVHPCWCLANHSCDPNVRWEWGARVEFFARKERVEWQRGLGEKRGPVNAGIKKGEEILSHYCDVDLDVHSRREWAQGALGGDCHCERCVWEAGD